MRTETPWGTWDPLTVQTVIELMRGFEAPWWVAGGYAIEAFVGYTFREHGDVDVSLRRDDQLAVQAHLAAWELQCADPPGTLRAWKEGEVLPSAVHDIWARGGRDDPWRFQLMLNESEGETWVSRRDVRIRRSLAELTFARDGVRFLVPEVQLLFKAKGLRPKDEIDFEEARPLLTEAQRSWLVAGLRIEHPNGHPWLARL